MPETMGSAAAKVLRSFCVLSGALSFCQRLGSGPFSDPRKPLGFKRDLDIRRASRKSPRDLRKSRVANIPRNGVQHRETPAKPGFCAALDGVGNYAAWAAACCRM